MATGLVILAYFSIPLALFHFVRRRGDLKYRWMFLMFAIFIMASGVTHVMNIGTFWDPDYVASGMVKAVTAVASVATATLLWPITPKALSISSPITLRATNTRLLKLFQRNESLVRAFDEIVYDHDVPARRIDWGGAYTKILGYQRQEMGDDEDSWLDKVHPDDLPSVRQEFDRAFSERRLYDLEYRFRRRDGAYIWMHDRGVMYGEEKRLECVIGLMRDITEPRWSDRLCKLQLGVLEKIAVGAPLSFVLTYLREEVEEMFSKSVCSIVQLPNGSGSKLLAGASLSNEFVEILEEIVPAYRSGALAGEPSVLRYTKTDPGMDPSRDLCHATRNWACWAYPIFSNDNRVLGIFSISHDLSSAPQAHHQRLLKTASHLAGIALQRDMAERALGESQQRLRCFAQNLNTTIEDERAHLAREIHDELGQAFTGLKMDLAWLARKIERTDENIDDPTLSDRINTMSEFIDGSVKAVRRITSELRPAVLDELGLCPALESLAQSFHERIGIPCDVKFTDDVSLTKRQSLVLYRICQEALTNVARHARATQVTIALKRKNGKVILAIKDNGRGITAAKASSNHSLGILGMEERARQLKGVMTIEGVPGEGARVRVEIPVDTEKNANRGAAYRDKFVLDRSRSNEQTDEDTDSR